MFYLLTLICVLSIVNAATDDEIRGALEEKIAECGPNGYRFYASQGHDVPSQDDDVTFERFKTTYNNVATHNTAYYIGKQTYLMAVNCFATVPAIHAMMTPPPNDLETVIGSSLEDSPDEYDRRDDDTTTDARNQGSCGSCWAFSGIAALESKYLILTGDSPSDVDFSEQQFLDCTYESSSDKDGCQGGWMTNAWQRLKNEEKSILMSETQRPYTKVDGVCDILELNKPNSMSKVVMAGTMQVGDSSVATIMGAATQEKIYSQGAVAIAIQVEDVFSSYESGIFNTQCESTSVNHALTLIGYTQQAFIAQNSWGTWWGDKGTVQLSRTNGNLCQMLSYTMWPLMECAWGLDAITGKCNIADSCGGCENNGHCNEKGDCECLDGYKGDQCDEKEGDACDNVECQNGGDCSDGKCKCKTGYTGDFCENKDDGEDQCKDIECQNGGECHLDGCYCKEGYSGDRCENKDDEEGNCQDTGFKCQNGGICTEDCTDVRDCKYECKCMDGFSGDKCEKKDGEDQCKDADFECQNGGTCMQECTFRGCDYACKCMEGYSGEHCQNEDGEDKCKDVECQNGGECFFGRCKCQEGFFGDKCQYERRDNCEDVECQNGGTCEVDTGKCKCMDGWEGDKCDEEEGGDKCEDVECQNGGTCIATTGECDCTDGYTGDECEEKEDTTCSKKCKGHKSQCYWKNSDTMKCKCPGMTYGKKCGETLVCDDVVDHNKCQKHKVKNPDRFAKRCNKVYGYKKCPVLCGYCPATESDAPGPDLTGN